MTVRQYKTIASGNNPGEGALTLGGVSDEFRQIKADIAQYLQSFGVFTASKTSQADRSVYIVSSGIIDLSQAPSIRSGQYFFVRFQVTNNTTAVFLNLFNQPGTPFKRTLQHDFEISGIETDRVYLIVWSGSFYTVASTFSIEDIESGSLNWDRLEGDLPIDRIEDDSIPYSKLTGTIPTDQIADGSIQNDKLDIADNSVSFTKLTGQILITQVANKGLTTAKIADRAITNAKIANGAITADKVAAGIITPSAAVPGMIVAFAGDRAPAGWLICNGEILNRNTYRDLFDAIGTRWGNTVSSSFRLPDLRGRVLAGAGSNSNRLDSSTLGNYIGSKSHRLTAAQSGLPTHDHAINRHRHGEVEPGGIEVGGNIDESTTRNPDQSLRTQSNAAQSASQSHPIVQPTALMNYIIKT